MQNLRGILIKMCSEPVQQIYTRGSRLGLSLINSQHSLSTALLTALSCFPLLDCKRIVKVVLISQ